MKCFSLILLLAQFTAFASTNFTIKIATNSISVPVPEGYVEVGAERRKAFPANSPNALLAWFIRTNDVALLEPNATNFFRSHFQAQTLKQWMGKSMSDTSFAKFVDMTAKEQEQATDPLMEDVTKILKESSGTNEIAAVAAPKQLGTIFKTDDSFAWLMLAGYSVKAADGPKRVPMIVGNAIAHIGNKCLFMYCYEYVENRDVQKAMASVREKLKPWVESTLAANQPPEAEKK